MEAEGGPNGWKRKKTSAERRMEQVRVAVEAGERMDASVRKRCLALPGATASHACMWHEVMVALD